MTRDEILDMVLVRAGQRQGDTTLRGQLESEMGFLQKRLEGGIRVGPTESGTFLPWFLLKEATATSEDGVIALPANFLREQDEEFGPTFYYYHDGADDPWIPLTKRDLVWMRQYYGASGEVPIAYALVGAFIHVRPIPTVETTYRLFYYGGEATLTRDVQTNAWTDNASDLLTADLSVAAARVLRDAGWAGDAAMDSKAARERLNSFNVARQEAGRDRSMGEMP